MLILEAWSHQILFELTVLDAIYLFIYLFIYSLIHLFVVVVVVIVLAVVIVNSAISFK